jgi:hypothetical protein
MSAHYRSDKQPSSADDYPRTGLHGLEQPDFTGRSNL